MRLPILSITVVMQRQLKTESPVSQSGIVYITKNGDILLISPRMFTQSFKINKGHQSLKTGL